MNAPLPKKLNHGRVKERYNPKPTERERDYHLWLIEEWSCACGCKGKSTLVHHPLRRHPMQRWRRDHEFVVPMTADCHTELHLHDAGENGKFKLMSDLSGWFRTQAIEAYKL